MTQVPFTALHVSLFEAWHEPDDRYSQEPMDAEVPGDVAVAELRPAARPAGQALHAGVVEADGERGGAVGVHHAVDAVIVDAGDVTGPGALPFARHALFDGLTRGVAA